MKNAIILTLAVLFGATATAGETIKTLPAELYATMKEGKKLEKVFVDPSFDKSKGFKLGDIEYRAENLNSSLMDTLKKSMGMIVRGQSPYTLHLAIVEVTTRTYTGFGYVWGKVVVEGRIVDETGKLVVAFIASERGKGAGLSGTDDYSVATDKIAQAIAKDLR